jgi:hypothetical protein
MRKPLAHITPDNMVLSERNTMKTHIPKPRTSAWVEESVQRLNRVSPLEAYNQAVHVASIMAKRAMENLPKLNSNQETPCPR